MKELAVVLLRQARQPPDVRPWVARRDEEDVLPVALHQVPDALPRVEPQEREAAKGARAHASEPRRALMEREQVPQAAQRGRREPVQHWVWLELFLAQREPEPQRDELRVEAPQGHGPQEHVLQGRVPRVRQ